MDNKQRIALEKAIVRALVEEMADSGFVPVTVWDGGCYEPQGKERAKNVKPRVLTADEVIEAAFAVDESTVHFAPADDLKGWGSRGVFLVGGNGEDIIGDYHAPEGVDGKEHPFCAACTRTYKRIQEAYVVLPRGA